MYLIYAQVVELRLDKLSTTILFNILYERLQYTLYTTLLCQSVHLVMYWNQYHQY